MRILGVFGRWVSSRADPATTFKINPTGSSIVQVNDVDLPETPVEVPAV